MKDFIAIADNALFYIFRRMSPMFSMEKSWSCLKMSNYLLKKLGEKLSQLYVDLNFAHFFSWNPESKFPFSQVFLPPKEGSLTDFVENQEIEVYSRANAREDCGWWTARIQVLLSKLPTFLCIL